MTNGLEYFKQVYDVIPGWVQKMHDTNPEMLTHYTALRGTAMSAGTLSVKEKDILLVGINAARHYARSMVYHTKGAIDGGATIDELLEYLVISYIGGGEQALQISLQSAEYALELKNIISEKISHDTSAEDIMKYYSTLAEAPQTKDFLLQAAVLIASQNEAAIVEHVLQASTVPTELKHVLATGIFVGKLKNAETDAWAKKAREAGATEQQLAELGYICLLTAGIPAWFEMSDALLEK